MSGVWDTLKSKDPGDIALMILEPIIILLICLLVKRILMKIVDKILKRSKVSKGIVGFVRTSVQIMLWLAIIIIVVSSINIIDTAPLVALFGAIGLAFSLAAQDTLSNLAAGINILVTKPFSAGDYVDIESDGGTVTEIGLVHTKLTTVDNKQIVLPNSTVIDARIINYAVEKTRRTELIVSASYDVPVAKVKSLLMAVIDRHTEALEYPEPEVVVSDFGDHGVEYVVRVWALQENYWKLYYALLEEIKDEFDQKGIVMKAPRMNIHIIEDNPQ